ncbi:signal recognition particle protein [Coxiella burnetii]|uniref:Signal recognition particle protein n=1 Tax=Coxiella burnetii (strain RSA 493 / Nine Mile phase I) TaxID=227377 RepID=Q83E79_COXBU|nr:signal recognition particle protein [Coxiella burnetii]NP_819486.1 signal recognition particle subunit FFH/SRP54 [Coxiella burnetii RSA 493]AAO90000.1 signal recognition particle, subunit FFH/SRP54 [Coxiella burnetii RSA 493]ARI65328.1 signal recognition particle protein [Coxiella burnetii]ARK26809.1 signal recognition particle protein [Coxiella burnetii]MCF2093271.1 signal recognition particle protein [Coxiella burnetii]MCF2095835.1 signal recognition particle protein [Coxiella burnetii]
MLNNLTNRLTTSINKLRGLGRLTEENIQSTLHDIRSALIEADVALPVVKDFIEHVREKALGQEVIGNVRPGEALVKVVQDELTHLLGDELVEINLNAQPPIVIVMAGLQGSGKTTTVAKLARWLLEIQKKSVMVASADVYRPAAIQQLETLASQINAIFFPTQADQKPVEIAKAALKQAEKQFMDVLILDTAGRLHIDNVLMEEMKAISDAVTPTEILLVVDSMMGQDAANVAKSFNDTLPLTGVILTKLDGDTRGGAALSMRMITQKPIKFVGVGEKIDALEPFHPNRMASRILGMGDIVSLVEEAQRKVDQKQAAKIAKKLQKGNRFDFDDFLAQLQQMKKMGGMQSLLGKLPGMGQLPKGASAFLDDKLLVKMQAIIQSMTLKERRFPALINGSRKRRISKGSGTGLQDVNKLLKQFVQMQKMMKRMKGDKMMKRFKQMQGKIPGDLLNQLPPGWRDK